MWKKLASIAAMVSAAVTVSACQTSMYKPIICEPGTALKHGRCEKVSRAVKESTRAKKTEEAAKPKYRPKKVTTAPDDGPGIQAPLFQPPRARQNVYGQPL